MSHSDFSNLQIKIFSQNTKGGPVRPPFRFVEKWLSRFYVFCLPALGPLHYVKLYLLTFLQAAEAIRLDGGEMHEDILAVLAADKSIALGIVKPLHCSCFHLLLISFI